MPRLGDTRASPVLADAQQMLIELFNRLLAWLFPEPVKLAIVRRYADANGAYVGELYMHRTISRKTDPEPFAEYVMIGASLDTLPLAYTSNEHDGFVLDAEHDFLRLPMLPNTVRVGGLTPEDDLAVRRMIYGMRRRPVELLVQNRFIEHILEPKEQGK